LVPIAFAIAATLERCSSIAAANSAGVLPRATHAREPSLDCRISSDGSYVCGNAFLEIDGHITPAEESRYGAESEMRVLSFGYGRLARRENA
jgi:hypothetical protein